MSPLSPQRAGMLMLLSFALPVGIWMIVSYTPFIWHPDVRLHISAEREGVTTVYTAGDHVSRQFFPEFVEAVRTENAARLATQTEGSPDPSLRRENQKILRQLAPVAVENGWLRPEQQEDDAAIYSTWRKVADGSLNRGGYAISAENLQIIRANWSMLSQNSNEFDFRMLPDRPLLKLVPQGEPANPVYLPAPHEVLTAGIRDFTARPAGDRPSMLQRLMHSIHIVFGGFLLSCLAGVPIGILCGAYDAVSKVFEPFIDFFRYMPAPAFATLLVAIFAAHDAPKIALVFIGTFFQMVLVVSKTTRQLDRSLIEAAQTLGAKRRQLLTHVVVPGVLPNLYNDLRILLGWSWTWLVIAELIGVKSGLTEFIQSQGQYRNFDRVWPVILLIGVLGFATDQVLALLRRFIFPYTVVRGQRSPVTILLRDLISRIVPKFGMKSAARPQAEEPT